MSLSTEIDEQKMISIITEFKKLTEKECYGFKLINEFPDILDDKLGGVPYLPVGEQHPKDKSGKPMPLLIQVNLKNIFLENFQNKGILEIFCGRPFDNPTESEVRYYDENLEYQKDLPLINYAQYIIDRPFNRT